MLNKLKSDLKNLSNPIQAQILSKFFKTGKGEYGEGDKFLGINVPQQREIAKKYQDIDIKSLQYLLQNKIHEYRLTALLILVQQFKRGDEKTQDQIFKFYIKNSKKINNWDLVDISAPNIVGKYLLERDKSILHKLAQSQNLREKRISIIATYTFIKNNYFKETFEIAEILLKDKHDLIHKAVGRMLREVGKIDQKLEEDFLKIHYKNMPRTMLRYAIEKFQDSKRKEYLKGIV